MRPLASALPLTLRTFSITLTSGYLFNNPSSPYLEIQDATGFDIADATINTARTTLSGTFTDPSFYALINSSYPYLRIRTDFSSYSTTGVTPGFTFTGADPNGRTVISGVVPAGPSSSVPEPSTWALLAVGLAGTAAAARVRRGTNA